MTHYDNEPTNAEILAELQAVKAGITALAAHVGLPPGLALVVPATDHQLNAQWGNPEVRRAPRNWQGEPVEGRCMSDLQPATLRALAVHFADLAAWHDKEQHTDDKGRPKSYYAKRDASFALGWALRLESQGHRGPARPKAPAKAAPSAPAAPAEPGEEYQGSDDDIPF